MNIKSIRWKPGFRSKGVDVESVHEALVEIKEKSELTPDNVISAAYPEDSALHPLFEWDDDKAAFEYRRSQARKVIASIEITYEGGPKEPMRAFEVVKQGQRSEAPVVAYQSVEEIMANHKREG